MKTNILTLLAFLAIAFSSCSKDKQNSHIGEGVCNLIINEPIIEIISKSGDGAATSVSDDYQIAITQTNGDYTLTGTYGELKSSCVLPVGEYKITAQNITAEKAIEGRGAQRFYGETTFSIISGVTTNVAFECPMVNARISALFNEDFKKSFKDGSLNVYESSDASIESRRELTFTYATTLENVDDYVYFNIDADPKVTIVVSATRNDDVPVNYTKTINIEAKHWHKIEITSTSVDGQGELDINVDETITSSDENLDFDPYGE